MNAFDELADFLDDDLDQQTRKYTISVNNNLVLSTPRDTGRAKGDWQVNFDTASGGNTGILDPTGQQTINRNTGEIVSFSGEYKDIYIENNLPYIKKLNDGSSTQAPAGFVESAIRAADVAFSFGG